MNRDVEAAKMLRKELKEKFPEIKFSVRKQSGGTNWVINIRYEDGPTISQVKELTGKYEMGNFDGMEDIYVNNNINDSLPQVHYVFVSRDFSEKIQNDYFKTFKGKHIELENTKMDELYKIRIGIDWASNLFMRELGVLNLAA